MSQYDVSRRTLDYYERSADEFWEGTRAHDVSQNIEAMLRHVAGDPPAQQPWRILDFGCGPGRDLARLRALGHEPVGLDGCTRFVEIARRFSRCEVLRQDFLALDLPPSSFDAIFANASLFHVPQDAIRRTLGELRQSLRPGGVLFSSNPRGHDEEGWLHDRYGVRYRDETWLELVASCGYVELQHYYRPEHLPREQQSWLASVWRRIETTTKGHHESLA